MWNSTNNKNDGGWKPKWTIKNLENWKCHKFIIWQWNRIMHLQSLGKYFSLVSTFFWFFFYFVFFNLVLAPCLIDNWCIELYTTICGQRNNKVKSLFPVDRPTFLFFFLLILLLNIIVFSGELITSGELSAWEWQQKEKWRLCHLASVFSDPVARWQYEAGPDRHHPGDLCGANWLVLH